MSAKALRLIVSGESFWFAHVKTFGQMRYVARGLEKMAGSGYASPDAGSYGQLDQLAGTSTALMDDVHDFLGSNAEDLIVD